jgi:hypothetical protein
MAERNTGVPAERKGNQALACSTSCKVRQLDLAFAGWRPILKLYTIAVAAQAAVYYFGSSLGECTGSGACMLRSLTQEVRVA